MAYSEIIYSSRIDRDKIIWGKNACMLSCFSCVLLFVMLGTVACQAPLSMGISRQEYRSGLPCPPPRDLPHPGIEPMSLTSPALAGGFFTTFTTWEAPWTKNAPACKSKNDIAAIKPSASTALYAEHWGNSGWEKNKLLALDKVHTKGRISMSDDSHLPIHRNVLKSLIWDIWFSLIVIFWCSDSLVFVVKHLCILAPPLPLQSSPTELFEPSPLRCILKVCQMKQDYQLLGCAFLLLLFSH